jgi:hypothetical protein
MRRKKTKHHELRMKYEIENHQDLDKKVEKKIKN